jgi:Flp pilus assembly protein TadG
MIGAFARGLRNFGDNTRGNVAILFGIALVPILLAVGIAVDYGRALIVRERMAEAADSAALAIGSWQGKSEAELKERAQQFFDANYPPSTIGTVGKLDVKFVGDDIKVHVDALVPTTFMRLANINTMDVGADAIITKKQRNIEVVLVLDVTGSMKGSKLTAMQNAAKKMVETLFEGKATSDTLKVGLVPYSGAVNIGTDKLNSGWLNKLTYSSSNNTKDPIPFEDFDNVSGISPLNFYKGGSKGLSNKSWAGCVRERGGVYELTDDAPSSGTPAMQWAPYFAPDEPDTGDFDNNYIGDGSYSSASCAKGPNSGSNKTKNQRQCFSGKYSGKSASGGGPEFNCPPATVLGMTSTKSTVTNAITALAAEGNTVIPAGLLWGWRVISPGAPYTEGSAYDDEKWIKAIVLLTDGENMVSGGGNDINKSVYNAFGYAKNGHLGNTDGSNAEATLNSKTSTVCGSIKAKGIQLYTIGFQVSGSTVTNLLKNCASKPDMYYNSPTNDQLAAIFQDIAQGLSELRIAQ